MTESMIVEAIRAAGGIGYDPALQMQNVGNVADPSAVERFQAALAPNAVDAPTAVPFASEVGAVWNSARAQNQEMLHRVHALSDLASMESSSMSQLIQLQYEIMNLSFQQDVVTKVADKASTAIQTLIKNQ